MYLVPRAGDLAAVLRDRAVLSLLNLLHEPLGPCSEARVSKRCEQKVNAKQDPVESADRIHLGEAIAA